MTLGHTNAILSTRKPNHAPIPTRPRSRLQTDRMAEADEKGALVYLDTALDNSALSLYKKLGFKEVGRSCIEDLTRYGGEGSHTHIALIKYPKPAAASRAILD